MWKGAITLALGLCHAASAWAQDFALPLPFEPLDIPPIVLDFEGTTYLPDLGGRIIPPQDHTGKTRSLVAAGWAESIATVRASFHSSSPWYQTVLEAGEAHGAKAFLDHHYAALARFAAAIEANGDGQFPSNPLAEWDYLTQLIPLIPQRFGGVLYDKPGGPLAEEEMRTLFAIRLFDTLPAPEQPTTRRLTLDHTAETQPNGSAIDTPLTEGEVADTLPYRRVTFTARDAGDVPVQAVRFVVDARYPIRILSAAVKCTGDRPMLCDVAGPGPFVLEVELLAPDLPEATFSDWHGVEVTAQTFENGAWQDAAMDSWGQTFSRCDADFVYRINAMLDPPLDVRALLDRISGMTDPNTSLPGKRLFPGPTRTALPSGEETRPIPPHPEAADLALRIDALAKAHGLDNYLKEGGKGGLNAAVSAAQRYGAMRQCHRPEAREHYDSIEVQLETVQLQKESYQRLAGYAQLGREAWIARVEAQRKVIEGQADRLGKPGDAFANFLSDNALGVFTSFMANTFTSVEVAARLGAASAVIGQAGAYLQIIQSLRELDTLLDWQQTIMEASAFMEAEAYAQGMVRTYEEAEKELTVLLRILREAEAAACTCYLPAPRYE